MDMRDVVSISEMTRLEMPNKTPDEWLYEFGEFAWKCTKPKCNTRTEYYDPCKHDIALFVKSIRKQAFEEAIDECRPYFSIEGIAQKCADAITRLSNAE